MLVARVLATLALLVTSAMGGCTEEGCKGGARASASADASADPSTTIAAHADLPTVTHWASRRAGGSDGAQTPRPAIVLFHGAGGPDMVHGKWLRPYTEALTAAGFEVFMPHYFEKPSQPEVVTALATVTFIAQQQGVSPDRIGAVGFSRGGFIAVEAAARDARIRAVVELYGGIHADAKRSMTRMPPTLILHGDKDPDVRVEHAYELQRLFEDEHVPYEMKIYPGEEHGFGGEALTDSVQRMVSFCERRLALGERENP